MPARMRLPTCPSTTFALTFLWVGTTAIVDAAPTGSNSNRHDHGSPQLESRQFGTTASGSICASGLRVTCPFTFSTINCMGSSCTVCCGSCCQCTQSLPGTSCSTSTQLDFSPNCSGGCGGQNQNQQSQQQQMQQSQQQQQQQQPPGQAGFGFGSSTGGPQGFGNPGQQGVQGQQGQPGQFSDQSSPGPQGGSTSGMAIPPQQQGQPPVQGPNFAYPPTPTFPPESQIQPQSQGQGQNQGQGLSCPGPLGFSGQEGSPFNSQQQQQQQSGFGGQSSSTPFQQQPSQQTNQETSWQPSSFQPGMGPRHSARMCT